VLGKSTFKRVECPLTLRNPSLGRAILQVVIQPRNRDKRCGSSRFHLSPRIRDKLSCLLPTLAIHGPSDAHFGDSNQHLESVSYWHVYLLLGQGRAVCCGNPRPVMTPRASLLTAVQQSLEATPFQPVPLTLPLGALRGAILAVLH
jgi:hypothetical protein